MAFSQRMDIKQGQSLVMTPQLQQAIKLLQFSNVEVSAFVEDELIRNPLLERAPADASLLDKTPTEQAGETSETRPEMSLEKDVSKTAADAVDGDFESTYAASKQDAAETTRDTGGAVDWSKAGTGGRSSFESSDYGIDQIEAEKPGLHDHLSAQLTLANLDAQPKMIASHLISMVEEDGYIRSDLTEEAARLGVEFAELQQVLSVLQGFDPIGVCARDLSECLALQLQELDRYDPAMQKMVENLDLLAKHDMAALLELCQVDAEDLADMVGELRRLDPKPGDAFSGTTAALVVPDVFIRQTPEGGWAVELNSDTLPKVLVNSRYYTKISKSVKSEADKTFISECHQSANWLVKSLDQRARTILKVATELVKQQDGFLVDGVKALRPLNLKTVADAIEMHESTVSRVTSNKFVSTPRGLFEMKYFFNVAIASVDGGQAHSAESVRYRIKGMIGEEVLGAVLSDDRIVEILREAGVDIARRTVAKYREAMHIPSSVQRRRQLRQTG
ncbi:RNA polymerase sigma-54 factor RpoN [hydrothermal vent metagenome]|uniref:RNA polymerase sigma-54 factor RpoN n=1 Tax=hydrothermal vent metagenome TaxID=652676 RepID=A0A3B0T7P1_9ZZZZ